MINYEKYVDSFEYVKDVESIPVYDNNKVENPFITVVVPTYKRSDLIAETLESIINQQPVDFEWNIIVVDNEAYDGNESETERIIKSFNCDRITHYRHSRTTSMYDNHNLGFKLAKAPWVMMCHDDDILLPNTLYKMSRVINLLQQEKGKPLGAIYAKYHVLKYDKNNPEESKLEVKTVTERLVDSPMSLAFYKLTHMNVLFTSHIGGEAPSNGSVFNKEAVIKAGGFNDRYGTNADLRMAYLLENNYTVYDTMEPYGFYRWGTNASSSYETAYEVMDVCNKFREYVFSKNIFYKIYGFLFRSSLYDQFGHDFLSLRALATSDYNDIEDYNDIYSKRSNKCVYRFWNNVLKKNYLKHKERQIRRLAKRLEKRLKGGI